MAGSLHHQLYETFVEKVPNPALVFMNHGYAPLDGDMSFFHANDGLGPSDPQRYSVNLLKLLLSGLDLEGKSILEVGAGRGGNCRYLARNHPGASVTGIDFCQGNVSFSRQNHVEKNLKFFCGDAQKLPFGEGEFDLLLNVESSHCYPDLGAFFREARRVLKPTGTFCYTDIIFQKEADAHAQQLAAAPFEVIDQADITAAVANAIFLNRDRFRDFLRGMVSADSGNKEMIEAVIHGINHEAYRAYETGAAKYKMWRLRPIASA